MVRRWRIEQITAGRAQMARLQALEARHLAALTDTVRPTPPPVPAVNGWSGRFGR